MKRIAATLVLAGCVSTPPVVSGPMPVPRHEHQAIAIGGLVYVIGGSVNGEDSARIDAFDPATGAFSRRADLLTARSFFGAAEIGGRIYVCGGPRLRAAEAYDPAADRWTAIAPAPFERTHFAAAAHDGRLWAIGGFGGAGSTGSQASATPSSSEGEFSADVWTYDPARDRWESGPPLPVGLHGHRAVDVGGELHVLGGTSDFADFTHHFVLRDGAWVRATPLPASALFFVAEPDGRSIVIALGLSPEVWRYDLDRDAWTRLRDLPEARYHAEGALAAGRLYLFGGTPASPSTWVGSDPTRLD